MALMLDACWAQRQCRQVSWPCSYMLWFLWPLLVCVCVCSKMPTPVQPDKQLFLGRLCVPNRPVPPLLASLMPQRLVRSAMEAVGDQQHKQQQKQMLGSSAAAGGSSNGSAAAVADGGLDGLLAPAGSNADAAAGQDQRQDQRQQKPVAKRLGNLRPQGDVQVLKKPKVVDGNHFGPTKRTDGSLASVSVC